MKKNCWWRVQSFVFYIFRYVEVAYDEYNSVCGKSSSKFLSFWYRAVFTDWGRVCVEPAVTQDRNGSKDAKKNRFFFH